MLIDMVTQWRSTYLMLEWLLKLKCVIQDQGSQKSYLAKKKWVQLN